MTDVPGRLQVGSPLPDQHSLINRVFDSLDEENRVKIFRNAGVPQILIGQQIDGQYVVKVSKMNGATPYDVTTATDDQLAFNSQQNTLKVVASGTQDVVVPASASTGAYGTHVTLPHGLDHVPAVIGYVSLFRDDEIVGQFWESIPQKSSTELYELNIPVDDTNAYFIVIVPDQNVFAGTYTFRYYFLQETAT